MSVIICLGLTDMYTNTLSGSLISHIPFNPEMDLHYCMHEKLLHTTTTLYFDVINTDTDDAWKINQHHALNARTLHSH